jgi:filamentous hemagglutinin family protein
MWGRSRDRQGTQPSLRGKIHSLLAIGAGCWINGLALSVSAQNIAVPIIPDQTLPTNTVVTPQLEVQEITGGTAVGSNLFHSFREFSVPTGITAHFKETQTFQNIITRVTGSARSDINGTIRADGSANFFLLNPNGILFGPNAQLNVGGSFVASTANAIRFSNGSEFSAINPQAPPLLVVNVPVGLQFGGNPAAIQVQGPGHQLQIDPSTLAIVRDNRPAGLQVQSGRTLALIGGDLLLAGGNLTSESGRIELGSVGSGGTVTLNPVTDGWTLGYTSISRFGDITLSQAASIDTSGYGGGNIQLRGQNISLLDGSSIHARPLGDSLERGSLTIRAAGTVTVDGFSIDKDFLPVFPSSLLTTVNLGAKGQGGDLTIVADTLRVGAGNSVSTSTLGPGDGGDLTVNARQIELVGASPLTGSGGLFASTFDTGKGGDITLTADILRIDQGGTVQANTFASGTAGNIKISAHTLKVTGSQPDIGVSSITASSLGSGTAGKIFLNTADLRVTDGAKIAADTFSTGDGGGIEVTSQNISVIGSNPNFGISSISAQVLLDASGNGGSLKIKTGDLLLSEGGELSTTTFGDGQGGNLEVHAKSIKIIGFTPDEIPSGIFAVSAEPSRAGSGGSIMIVTKQLHLSDGGLISTDTLSVGDAGNLSIVAEQLHLSSQAVISSATFGAGNAGALTITARDIKLVGGFSPLGTGIYASVLPGATGNGGTLRIMADKLQVFNGAQIVTGTLGAGNSGDLIITAKDIKLSGFQEQGSSGLFANAIADTGSGGNIIINSDRLSILDGATISASNFPSRDLSIPPGQGAAGDIKINAKVIKLADQGTITASTAQGDRGNIRIDAQNLFLQNQSSITTNASNTANGGNITLNTKTIVQTRNSNITANAIQGEGGNIQINTQGLFQSSDSKITAASQLGLNGTVNVSVTELSQSNSLTEQPNNFISTEQLVAGSCLARRNASQGVFVVTGNGGLPDNPYEALPLNYELVQVQPIQGIVTNQPVPAVIPASPPEWQRGAPIQEASGLRLTTDGRKVLVADANFFASAKKQTCVAPRL